MDVCWITEPSLVATRRLSFTEPMLEDTNCTPATPMAASLARNRTSAFSSIEKEPAQARTFVASPTPALTPTAVVPELPSPTATAEPSRSQIERLVIPSAGIDASVVTLGVKPDGEMQTPNTPNDVGWYDFTAYPGFGSNAVFSGHVDYAAYVAYAGVQFRGRGVFFLLGLLSPGDVIEVDVNGATLTYAVEWRRQVSASDADWAEIYSAGVERDSITLITCGGDFDFTTSEYADRVVVRAVRT